MGGEAPSDRASSDPFRRRPLDLEARIGERLGRRRDELAEQVLDGWEIPDLDTDLTARESRYREKEAYVAQQYRESEKKV